jgi:hypothetical protein
VTSFQPPHRFDLWHDRAVFHFLTAAGTVADTLRRCDGLCIRAAQLCCPRSCWTARRSAVALMLCDTMSRPFLRNWVRSFSFRRFAERLT